MAAKGSGLRRPLRVGFSGWLLLHPADQKLGRDSKAAGQFLRALRPVDWVSVADTDRAAPGQGVENPQVTLHDEALADLALVARRERHAQHFRVGRDARGDFGIGENWGDGWKKIIFSAFEADLQDDRLALSAVGCKDVAQAKGA